MDLRKQWIILLRLVPILDVDSTPLDDIVELRHSCHSCCCAAQFLFILPSTDNEHRQVTPVFSLDDPSV